MQTRAVLDSAICRTTPSATAASCGGVRSGSSRSRARSSCWRCRAISTCAKASQWPLGRAAAGPALGHRQQRDPVREPLPEPAARKRAAEDEDAAGVRFWLVVCLAFGVAFNLVRVFEFSALNCRWDTMPTARSSGRCWACTRPHLLTDVVDTAVLTAAMFTRPIDGQSLCRCQRECVLLVFRRAELGPIYAVIYLAPRL